MPNLKEIKNRINSVESTKKITRAMKMVAAAKVRKAESSVKASRPYNNELMRMFSQMLDSVGEFSSESLKIRHSIDNYPELLRTGEIKNVGILVITANKGLAGAYNSNVVRLALKKEQEYSANGVGVKFFVVGQKGISTLRKKSKSPIEKKYFTAIDNPVNSEASIIAEDLAEYFVKHKIDKIEILTTTFRNMVSYSLDTVQVLPVSNVRTVQEKIEDGIPEPLMEFTPDIHHILQKLVPMYISNTIHQSLMEAHASELASRMSAMSAATTNAERIIKDLSVQYNKIRQSAITNEIIEVINGANAQKR